MPLFQQALIVACLVVTVAGLTLIAHLARRGR